MASLDSWNQYTDLSNKRANILTNAGANVEKATTDYKTSQGYDQKIKELEDANKQVLSTRKMLQALPDNVKQRIAGRNVTNAQLNRITASESDPLTRQLSDFSQSAGLANDNVSRLERNINDYRANKLRDYMTQADALGGQADSYFKKYQTDLAQENQESDRALQKTLADSQTALQKYLYGTNNRITPTATANPSVSISTLKNALNSGALDMAGEENDVAPDDYGKDIGNALSYINPLNMGAKDAGTNIYKDYIDYVNSQNKSWTDRFNPVKNIGNLFNFLGGKR